MKKKLMMVAVLLGALTLGACVDDNESASVTAIRNAKAAQLQALAAYQNAQAEAELIIANADAAIKAAEAAYKEAEARWQAAQADKQEIEVQKAQATLETDLAAAQAQAEAALIAAQAQLEQAKAALISASDQVDLATQAKIQNLIAAADAVMKGGSYQVMTPNYDSASGSWTTSRTVTINADESLIGTTGNPGLKRQLINKQADLVKAQYDLEDTKIKIQQYVADEQAKLAQNEALLKAYNDNKTTDYEDAQKAYDEAVQAKQALQKANDDAWKAYQAAANGTDGAITKAIANLNATEISNYLNGYIEIGGYSYYARYWLYTIGYISYETPDPEKYTVTYDDGTASEGYTYYNESKVIVETEEIAADITSLERELAIAEADYDVVKEAYDEAMDADNTTYKGLKKDVEDAQEAFDEEPTSDNKEALKLAEDALKGYEDVEQRKLDAAQGAVDDAQEELDALKAVQTKLTGDAYTTYSTVYDAYVAAVKASVDPYIAYLQANHNLSVQNSLISALSSVISQYTDWATLIEGVEEDIRDNNKNIALMTDNGTTTGETEASRQAYIDALNVEIAEMEQDIAILQAQYDGFMEQIQALIGEETPAE